MKLISACAQISNVPVLLTRNVVILTKIEKDVKFYFFFNANNFDDMYDLRQIISDTPKLASIRARPVVASRSSSSGSSVGPQTSVHNRQPVGKMLTSTKSRLVQPRAGPRNHSFMRPTAASVNKGSIPNLPKSIKSLVK